MHIYTDNTIKLDYVRQWMDEQLIRKWAYGHNSFVANDPQHEYQLDMVCIRLLEDQTYDTAVVRIDAFSKYASVVPRASKTESDLAHGMIESFVNMGNRPKIIYTAGETGIRHSWLFPNYTDEKIPPCITPKLALPSPSDSCLLSSLRSISGSNLDNNGRNLYIKYW